MTIRFREINRDTFDAIRAGRKKVETRAATEKYRGVQEGDVITLVCGKDRFEKKVKKAEHFRTIGAMLKIYEPSVINPNAKTEKELRAMYASFPSYSEKLKRHGIVAWTL